MSASTPDNTITAQNSANASAGSSVDDEPSAAKRQKHGEPKVRKFTLFHVYKRRIHECIQEEINDKTQVGDDEIMQEVKYWLKPGCAVPNMTLRKDLFVGADKRKCFLLRFARRNRDALPDVYTLRLFGEKPPVPLVDEQYVASLVIIPRPGPDDNEALIYGFGHWHWYINRFAIKLDWGLRIAVNEKICGESVGITSGTSGTLRAPNHKTIKEDFSEPDSLEYLSIKPGENYLRKLTVESRRLPPRVTGSDTLVYSLKPNELTDLVKSSDGIYDISLERTMHEHALLYLDEEEFNPTIRKSLNEKLWQILKDRQYSLYLVSFSEYDNEYLGKDLEFSLFSDDVNDTDTSDAESDLGGSDADEDNVRSNDADEDEGVDEGVSVAQASDTSANDQQYGSFFPALERLLLVDGASLESKMSVRDRKTMKVSRVHVFSLIRALSIPLVNDNLDDDKQALYRYNIGSWFVISKSRIARVRNNLDQYKITHDECGFKDYCESSEGTYNSNAVKAFNRTHRDDPQSFAIVLDRKMVLTAQKGKFEFGDILVVKPDKIYIIHAKRASLTGLSGHHSEQILRCIECLNGTTRGVFAWRVLVKACITTMQEAHNVNALEKGWRGNPYNSRYLKIKNIRSENWKENFLRKVSEEGSKPRMNNKAWLRIVTFLCSDQFISGYDKEYLGIVNALVDCNIEDPVGFTPQIAESYLLMLNQCIGLKSQLFPRGSISRETRTKTYIVMALIDDEGSYTRCSTQQLPAYETVISAVTAAGFKFAWTLIPKGIQGQPLEVDPASIET